MHMDMYIRQVLHTYRTTYTLHTSYSVHYNVHTMCAIAFLLLTTGVPEMVPDVTVNGNTININGHNVTFTLSWGEPFNNLDPIVNYTVSCSGDDMCPPNFTTTASQYTITNLTPMTNYTFSVVATNSIGSGEAGVVMITTPGEDECIFTQHVRMLIGASLSEPHTSERSVR